MCILICSYYIFSYTLFIYFISNTPVSPIKGLSVREDTSGCPAIHQKIGKNKYVCLANFFFGVNGFAKFPLKVHSRYNGYILFVKRVDGVSMQVYYVHAIVVCDNLCQNTTSSINNAYYICSNKCHALNFRDSYEAHILGRCLMPVSTRRNFFYSNFIVYFSGCEHTYYKKENTHYNEITNIDRFSRDKCAYT